MNTFKNARALWDPAAARFDDEPDHGLRDPTVLDAWTKLLLSLLPPAPACILDAGCGTGSLSVVMARAGYTVSGIDASPEMLRLAEHKAAAAGCHIDFRVMDAARPTFAADTFDAAVCRHVLWALPEPACVLQWWAKLLHQEGLLLLIEGYWFTEAGIHADDILTMIPEGLSDRAVHDLSGDSALWGRDIYDERFAIAARRPAQMASANPISDV